MPQIQVLGSHFHQVWWLQTFQHTSIVEVQKGTELRWYKDEVLHRNRKGMTMTQIQVLGSHFHWVWWLQTFQHSSIVEVQKGTELRWHKDKV